MRLCIAVIVLNLFLDDRRHQTTLCSIGLFVSGDKFVSCYKYISFIDFNHTKNGDVCYNFYINIISIIFE